MKRMKKVLVAVALAFVVMFAFNVVADGSFSTTEVKAAVKAKNQGTKYAIKGQKFKVWTIGARGKVRYYTSNKKIATINSKGLVTTKGCGTVRITVKASNLNNYWTIKVENPKASISSKTVKIGQKFNFKIKGTKQKVTYKSYNTKVATVNSKGQITVKAKGIAYIYATLKQTGKSFYVRVYVK